MPRISQQRAAKAEAIIYIQSHEGLSGVSTGDQIEYASPVLGGGWNQDIFTVTQSDLEVAEWARNGTIDLPRSAASGKTARIVRDTQ